MKRFRKNIAIIISIMMLYAYLSPSFVYAKDLSTTNFEKTTFTKDVVYIDDDNGEKIPVEITETIYYNENSTIAPMLFNPLSKVGETRSYTVKITNNMMGVPSAVTGGLSLAAKRTAAKVAEKAIIAKLGASFIPGLNFVTWALGVAALANAISGKTGIEITVGLKYIKTYLQKEGYYVEGWSPISLSVRRY